MLVMLRATLISVICCRVFYQHFRICAAILMKGLQYYTVTFDKFALVCAVFHNEK